MHAHTCKHMHTHTLTHMLQREVVIHTTIAWTKGRVSLMHPSKWSLLQFSSDMNYLLVVYLLSCMDSSLLSNIQKLFYERIEVFSAVDFSKLSIVTGIIKIVLKVQYIKNAPFHTCRSTNTHIRTSKGFAGVCTIENVWKVWIATNASWCSLPSSLPLEIRLWRTVSAVWREKWRHYVYMYFSEGLALEFVHGHQRCI